MGFQWRHRRPIGAGSRYPTEDWVFAGAGNLGLGFEDKSWDFPRCGTGGAEVSRTTGASSGIRCFFESGCRCSIIIKFSAPEHHDE